jgi:hypothetical protein
METFENGAARSEKRPWYRLVSREALELIAKRAQLGMEKTGYTEWGWKKGGPDFFNEAMNHVTHHWFMYMNNDESEESNIDNLAAALWGMCALAWWELTGKAKWQTPAPATQDIDATIHADPKDFRGYLTDKDRP